MVMLSDENAFIGDRVYDVVHGYGKIVDTAFGDIVVRFDSGIRITFSEGGFYAGVRRLYWHNPVVVEPTKDNKLWQTMRECLLSIHSYLDKS